MTINHSFQWKISSPIGELYLAANKNGLSYLGWEALDNISFLNTLDQNIQEAFFIKQAARELQEYFNGERTSFEVPLDITGTDFQKNVWKQLLNIPFGKTKSYKQIADSLATQAVRAVGSANGKNQICIIIPCHRVINSNGQLGGFSGGLHKKEFLLKFENSQF